MKRLELVSELRRESRPHCAVCGETMRDIPRTCGRCEAPYHVECWHYNDGCAIYGCEPRRVRPAMAAKVEYETSPAALTALGGPLFGTLLGAVAVMAMALVLHPDHTTYSKWCSDAAFWIGCGALLGGLTGCTVRGMDDHDRILFSGFAGPGLAAWALGTALSVLIVGGQVLLGAVILLPFVMLFSVVMIPFAVPCAYLTGFFNDPARTSLTQLAMVLCLVMLALMEFGLALSFGGR